ncbi:MAG TPA: hypothetical protein VHA52_08690 [Candidatus Babeliaceae bacterium]|nr:hypothetical protein [Candidatus Babeliaceae bacterium]
MPILKLRPGAKVTEYSPTSNLLDPVFIGRAIVECLQNNDPEGVMEVISAHLNALNKTKAASQAGIARSTLYHSLRGKNPTIKTLAKIMHGSLLEVKR